MSLFRVTDANPDQINRALDLVAQKANDHSRQIAAASKASKSLVDGLAAVATTGAAADISGLAAVATTGAASDLTGTLAAARLPNSGSAIGRVAVPVLIDIQSLSAASTYTSPTWAGGAYRNLQLLLRVNSGSSTGGVITLGGLSGTYKMEYQYANSPTWTPQAFGYDTIWGYTGAIVTFDARMDIRVGGLRSLRGSNSIPTGAGSGVQQEQVITGFHTDTTHAVTNLGIAFSSGPATGDVELWGIPG